ncbi:MAG: FAD-dependent oxidoreductase, partial [Nitriliruptorales bacterium]|nr:FAD-dependent oxidoreductase [Nitriliruptorales bacterium]
LVTYDRAFWRERGLSGEAVSTGGPISVTFDATSADGAVPALVAFVVGRPADALRGAGEDGRRRAVVDHLAQLFGEEAREVASYADRDWSEEEWTGGCPVAVPAPGVDVSHVDPREPVGPIHWAGTETATAWSGYLEGAIEAGQRAGREVVTALRGASDLGSSVRDLGR